MKRLSLTLFIIFTSYSAYADEVLIGKWVDKSHPGQYQLEFFKDNDFAFTLVTKRSSPLFSIVTAESSPILSSKTKTETSIYKGVWETGDWIIKKGDGTDSKCSLTIYIDSVECCFMYKFIGNNLILTNKYRSDEFAYKCDNRVLVRPSNK